MAAESAASFYVDPYLTENMSTGSAASVFEDPYFTQLGNGGFCHTNKDKSLEVVNQQKCDSCTSQSVTLAASMGCAIHYNNASIRLAPQCSVDCGEHNNDMEKEPDARGCKTARFQHIYNFASNHGFNTELDYGYTADKGECDEKEGRWRLHIGPTGKIKTGEPQQLVLDRIRIQPVTAKILITPKFLTFTGQGVYDPIEREGDPPIILDVDIPKNAGHAVTVIGFGVTDSGQEYYIIQNSYGPNWGFKGFAKVPRDCLTCFRFPQPPYVWRMH